MTVDAAALVSALPMPGVLVGPDGRITTANTAADGLFGMALAGRNSVVALRHPDLVDAVAAAISEGRSGEVRYRARNGSEDRHYRVSIAPLGAGKRHALVLFADATAIEAADQMRRDFVANVSHELKTPLTALLGFIETLRGGARDDGAVRERFLAIMEREAQRMNRLVADLLSLSRVEDEERVRPRSPANLAVVVRRSLAALRANAEAAGVMLVAEGVEGACIVTGDTDQLQQVVTNLVENAIKYGRPNGTVTVRLHPASPDPGLGTLAVRLDVIDEGEGIDPVHIPRLTERFYRVDSHRSRASGGTGLGLAIVKYILNRHRGRLAIESRKGAGSRFSAILPAAPPAAGELSQARGTNLS